MSADIRTYDKNNRKRLLLHSATSHTSGFKWGFAGFSGGETFGF